MLSALTLVSSAVLTVTEIEDLKPMVHMGVSWSVWKSTFIRVLAGLPGPLEILQDLCLSKLTDMLLNSSASQHSSSNSKDFGCTCYIQMSAPFCQQLSHCDGISP